MTDEPKLKNLKKKGFYFLPVVWGRKFGNLHNN